MGIRVQTINCDNGYAKAMKWNVTSVPTFIVVENGKEVRRKSGGLSRKSLERLVSGSWL